MLVLAKTHDTLKIVNDQLCTPSYVPHVASAMIRLLDTQHFGTYHVTNRGSVHWLDFARELFGQAGLEVSLIPISTEQYGAAAPRAAFSVLDTSKFRALKIADLPSWQEGLQSYLRSLNA
jgi:dTDP-4-dehydrorhamnose reductase